MVFLSHPVPSHGAQTRGREEWGPEVRGLAKLLLSSCGSCLAWCSEMEGWMQPPWSWSRGSQIAFIYFFFLTIVMLAWGFLTDLLDWLLPYFCWLSSRSKNVNTHFRLLGLNRQRVLYQGGCTKCCYREANNDNLMYQPQQRPLKVNIYFMDGRKIDTTTSGWASRQWLRRSHVVLLLS